MYPDAKIIPFGIINKMFVWRKDKIMGRDLQGRVAIVTGSGRGIGLGIAKKLSEKGASVVISDVNEDNARNGVAEIEAMGLYSTYPQHPTLTATSARQTMRQPRREW